MWITLPKGFSFSLSSEFVTEGSAKVVISIDCLFRGVLDMSVVFVRVLMKVGSSSRIIHQPWLLKLRSIM